MARHDFQIPVFFKHRVVFTRNAFSPEHSELADILREGGGKKVIVFIEETLVTVQPELCTTIESYLSAIPDLDFRGYHLYPGGEYAKSNYGVIESICRNIDQAHIDRHSYMIAIGGGAFLDAVGYAASISHRGIRLIRFPSTTLSQDDSGVGVKCAINAFDKKNWMGAFSVPYAVINDFDLLKTLPPQICRDGLIEAVKVALVKDEAFFTWIETHIDALASLDDSIVTECITQSALLHVRHIAEGGDPFETGSSRPLDFGHWAGHKLESLTNYQLSHAQAVAIGIALDTVYSSRIGLAPASIVPRVFDIISKLGLKLYHPALDWLHSSGSHQILDGIHEFREHLGGELTILMLKNIGIGMDIHTIDQQTLLDCIAIIRNYPFSLHA